MKKKFYIGKKLIGDGNVTVQSMTNTLTTDVEATVAQIRMLAEEGADFVRVSVPDEKSAIACKEIVKASPVPIIADIHFGDRPALIAIENGVHKIRVNPGNMSDTAIRNIVKKCAEYNVPIRVGINKGSSDYKTPLEMAFACVDVSKKIEDMGFDKLVLAVKTSSVIETVRAYEKLYELTDYPLHIGLTESGAGEIAKTKSAVAIGSLLLRGIGDTVRVSLAGDPAEEVRYAKSILRAVGIDKNFVEIIACPTCARTCFPVEETALKLQELTKNIRRPIKIAVMGCVVNGIGEGKAADFGVAGGEKKSIIFERGEKVALINNEEILPYLLTLTEKYGYDE